MDHRVSSQVLIGVLALQKRFVSQSALVDAFALWVGERHRGLADIFISKSMLDPAQRDQLLSFVEQHLRESGDDPVAALHCLHDYAEIQAALLELATADVNATVLQPGASVNDRVCGDSKRSSDSAIAETIGVRFVVIKPLAHGGLGSVSIARDLELNRQIALKEILPERADDFDSQIRFKREAEITGGLEHPGIVPVYGLGVYGNGRPFYAMRLIHGDSLKKAISEFHAARQSGAGGFESLAFRGLLRRMVDVCNAIQYAHDRCVLHRDLKPGNIMVGQYGETLVVDWGLAKPLAERTAPTSGESTSATIPPLVPRTALADTGSTETQTGEVKGTPAYMSPEQARGEWDSLGTATDVYALGATLYSILTGKPPVEAGSAIAALKRAAKGDIRPPRELISAVPRSLAAICQKAMAARPQDRYAAASELAADLERWLADEPVTAARETTTERLSRVTRKHRMAALTAVAASILLAVVSSTAALVISGLRDAEQVAREAAGREATAAKEAQTETARQLKRAEHLVYNSNIREANRAWQDSRGDTSWDILASIRFDLRDWDFDELAAQHVHSSRLRLMSGSYHGLSFSPDGTILTAIGAGDLAVHLYDTRTGQLIRTLPSKGGTFLGSAFTSQGDVIITGTPGGEFCRWNPTTGDLLTRVQLPAKGLRCFALHPQGQAVVAGDDEKAVRIFDLNSGAEVRGLSGHTGYLQYVAFSPDGEWIAGGNLGSELLLWSARTGVLTRKHQTQMQVFSIAFSSDSKTVAAGWLDGTVTMLDMPTGRVLQTLAASTVGISAMAFSPIGNASATAGEGGSIRIWDPAGERTAEWKGHHFPVTELAFSPDGRTLASSSTDLTLRLWTVSAESQQDSLIQHDWPVTDVRVVSADTVVSVSMDGMVRRSNLVSGDSNRIALKDFSDKSNFILDGKGTRVAAYTGNMEIRVWDAHSGEYLGELTGHKGVSSAVSFSREGDRLASAGQDGLVRVWNTTTTRSLWVSPRQIGMVQDVIFSPTQDVLASAYLDAVRLWNGSTGALLKTLVGTGAGCRRLSFSDDGMQIACSNLDQSITVWSVESGEVVNFLIGNAGFASRMAFSPDAKWLVTLSDRNELHLWDLETGQPVRTLESRPQIIALRVAAHRMVISGTADGSVNVQDTVAAPAVRSLRGHAGEIRSLGFDSKGELRSVSDNGWIRAWHVGTGALSHSTHVSDSQVLAAAILPDGSRCFTNHRDGSLQVTSLRPQGRPVIVDKNAGNVLELTVSWDGRTVAGSTRKGVHLWDATTGHRHRTLAHSNAQSAVFAPDGQKIATGGAIIQVWNLDTEKPLHTLTVEGRTSDCLAFSPDSRTLAAGYDDGSILLWSAEDGRQIQKLVSHLSGVRRLSYSPDGKWLASSGACDGQICLWNVSTNELEFILNTQGQFITLGFSPDSELLCSSGARGQVHLWPLDKITSQLTTLLERSRLKAAMGNLAAARRNLEQLVSLGYWSPRIEAGFRDLDIAQAPPPSRRKRRTPPTDPLPNELPGSVNQFELAYVSLGGTIVTQLPQPGAPVRNRDWKQRPLSLQSRGSELIAILPNGVWQIEGPDAPRELFKTDVPWMQATWDFGTGQVAFCRGAPGETPHLYIQAPGKEPRDLGFGYDPTFGPDGKLACLLWKRNRFEIAVISDRNELSIAAPLSQQLTVYPLLSPDGDEIAFSMAGKDGTRQIGLVDADPRSQAFQLTTHGPRPASLPSFSPEGRFLAYLVGDPPKLELRVRDLETNADIAIASDAAFVRPVWKESGK